jgi:hypothetical protein
VKSVFNVIHVTCDHFGRRASSESDSLPPVQAASEDYEQILSSLALDIQKRQSRLSDIRLRERRSTLLTTVYAFSIWALYVSLWYTGLLPNFSGRAREGREGCSGGGWYYRVSTFDF